MSLVLQILFWIRASDVTTLGRRTVLSTGDFVCGASPPQTEDGYAIILDVRAKNSRWVGRGAWTVW